MLRWEDCVKRDARKAGDEEDWKERTIYMEVGLVENTIR